MTLDFAHWARHLVLLVLLSALPAWAVPQTNDEPTTAAADTDTATTRLATRPAAVVKPPLNENFRIYVLMGQSNMVGRDARALKIQVDDPRVLALNADGQWVVAHEPIHAKGSGIGSGVPFVLGMLIADPGVTIGLVPCAVGSPPLTKVGQGGRALRSRREARQAGCGDG